ncbi:MAG: tRNA (adenosine(37)-N6)-threonylcarbamoyltransferase complex transferase subunit TsaD [Gammaproteobacteria bacterium]
MPPLILGIETSCDDTAAGIYGGDPPRLFGHLDHRQLKLHAEYGGIVPELAAREHQRYLAPLLQNLLAQTDLNFSDLDAIACTAGPGLLGSLKTGLSLASGLALGLNLPLIRIHHLEAHLLSVRLEHPLPFPWLTLLVSGGHSQLIMVQELGEYRILGSTRDDAAGEAFDKIAKLLNLPYPGGPAIEALAQRGNAKAFAFPRPMQHSGDFDFSFSGLKTAVFYCLKKQRPHWQPGQDIPLQLAADIAASFQQAVADILVHKTGAAFTHCQPDCNQVVIAGGVGSNTLIRNQLSAAIQALGGEPYFPRPAFCVDNGAMIALAGWTRFANQAQSVGQLTDLQIQPRSRWSVESLTADSH